MMTQNVTLLLSFSAAIKKNPATSTYMQDLNTQFYLYISTHSHAFPRETFPLLPNSHLLLLFVMCLLFVTTFTCYTLLQFDV